MPDTERMTVTLPASVAESLRRRMATGDLESASGFVVEVLEDRFREERLEEFLMAMESHGAPVGSDARAARLA